MRTNTSFKLDLSEQIKNQLLFWSQAYEEVIWLDSNDYKGQLSDYDAILAVGAEDLLQSDFNNAFKKLETYYAKKQDWIFGYLAYDLKNSIEDLTSQNFDALGFAELCFFQPKKLILFKEGQMVFKYLKAYQSDIESDLRAMQDVDIRKYPIHNTPKIKLRIHKDDYFAKVEAMLGHIRRGDIYEANFCQEFYADNLRLNPIQTFQKLNAISKPPFATYLRLKDKYLMSASPERFLKKKGNRLISQPIKGTARRSEVRSEDERLKKELQENEKERSENIMIVDLVRNDLSHTAKPGSVKVTELCEVFSFLQVHQMISTVESQLKEGISSVEAIKYAFPMGSMTGAPKISAMKIIEELEETKRGLYSGSVGYFTPEDDFDFNVVIRSILYNSSKNYASYSVGSAITAKSNPQLEYEECLLKAKAMREVLEN